MIGKQLVVRRMKNGQYVLSAAPNHKPRELTGAQKEHCEKFRQAVLFAKTAQNTPEYKDAAATRGLSAYNVAVADFMHRPQIQKVDTSAYQGHANETITITAVDDVKVKTVGVRIVNDDGTHVEKGTAVVPTPVRTVGYTRPRTPQIRLQ